MKILIATGLYPPESGGPATYAKFLEDELPKQGVEVIVLPFKVVRAWPPGVRHVLYFLHCARAARGVAVVYAQDTVSVGLPAALAARAMGVTFVVRVPGDYAWEQGRQRFGVVEEIDAFQHGRYGWRVELLRRLQRFVVRRAARVVVPSRYMQGVVSGWVNDPTKIICIYSSVALPVPHEDPPQRPAGFLVVTTARLVPWKGIDRLIEVVARESAWSLVVVGDGPERASLEGVAQQLRVRDRVQFVGQLPRAQALGWVAAADVFVLNSTYEGLSYLLVETASLGVPVIATRIGGNPEIIEDEETGLLVPSQDNEALHAALLRVQRNPEEARRMARAGMARVTQHFASTSAIASLVSTLNTL